MGAAGRVENGGDGASRPLNKEGEKMEQKTEYFKASVYVTGVKNRCRKTDGHLFDLGKYDNVPEKSAVYDAVVATVKENMKTWELAKVTFYKTSFDGIFENVALMGPHNVKYTFKQ